MWHPKYTITNKMLHCLRQIGEAMGVVKSINISGDNLVELKYQARVLSSFASTSIEGNPLPLTDVKRLIKQSPKVIRDTEKEIINYNKALVYINKKVKAGQFKLSHSEITHIQSLVVDGLMANSADVGKYRKRAVVIRDPRSASDIRFIPPDYKDVKPLMDNLINFINRNVGKIDAILLAGLFHKQYVIIHPFMDGNGRTTRLITTALLGSLGFNLLEIFSLENYYNQNVSKYFDYVGAVGDYYETKNDLDFTNWLEYFADGLLDELKRVQKTLPNFTKPPRLEKHHQDILKFIEKSGSISQKEYTNISNRSLAARKQDFKKLVEIGLISAEGKGKATYYVKL
ncbi:MAG: Fic family protein [Pseudomonadota bacterium]